MKKILFLSLFLLISANLTEAQLVTNFGLSATNGGGWTYTAGTSTLTGNEGPGDLLFGTPSNFNLSGTDQLRISANVITAPSAGFSVVLEDSSFLTATAQFNWNDFVGGATVNSLITPDAGFNYANVTGWTLLGGGSSQSINASLISITAIPEPSTSVLIGLAVGGLALARRFRKSVA